MLVTFETKRPVMSPVTLPWLQSEALHAGTSVPRTALQTVSRGSSTAALTPVVQSTTSAPPTEATSPRVPVARALRRERAVGLLPIKVSGRCEERAPAPEAGHVAASQRHSRRRVPRSLSIDDDPSGRSRIRAVVVEVIARRVESVGGRFARIERRIEESFEEL